MRFYILSIFDNEILHMAAETLLLVTGSMLLGILISYTYYTRIKKRLSATEDSLADAHRHAEELRKQLQESIALQRASEEELETTRARLADQSRTIYHQQQTLDAREDRASRHQAELEELRTQAESYQQRMALIERELTESRADRPSGISEEPVRITRAGFDHVSDLMGRPVTENDLTVVTGIGPKTAALLDHHGIGTWQALAESAPLRIRELLDAEGGVYRAIDPTHWAEQAGMAARGEWRKLRAFQDYLRKGAKG